MFVCISYEVVSESSRTLIVVTGSVKDALFLHKCFQTSGFILSAMGGKIEKRVCMKFCLKLGKSATETLQMLCEPLDKNSLS
jgi:hypothetical protein